MEFVEAETVMHFKADEFDEKLIRDLKRDLSKLPCLSSVWKNISDDPKLTQFKEELRSNKKLTGNKKLSLQNRKKRRNIWRGNWWNYMEKE